MKDPPKMWDAQKSFKCAISDKLAEFTVTSTQGDETRAGILEKGMLRFANDPSVKLLPWQKVVDETKKGHAALLAWTSRIDKWQIGEEVEACFDCGAEKKALEEAFAKWDAVRKQLGVYESTLAQLEQDSKLEVQEAQDERKQQEYNVYMNLRCRGVPGGIGKAK